MIRRPISWRWCGAVLVALAMAAGPLMPRQAIAQTEFRPVAVVNDSAITGFDLAQRARLMVALGLLPADSEDLEAVALDQLVLDRLKLQAGRVIGLKPTPGMIKTGISELAQRAKISVAEFTALMSNQGVTAMALEDLVGTEGVWRQVIRARFANRVQPGEAEIEAELALLQQHGSSEYRILEIGLPLVADGRTEAQTRALADRLVTELNDGGDFAKAVAKYSKATSAGRDGDVGWVSTTRMPPELARAVAALSVGSVSAPLSVPGGLSLLKLVEKRSTGAIDTSDPRLRERIRKRLIIRKSARLAEGLLQELRRDALIETR